MASNFLCFFCSKYIFSRTCAHIPQISFHILNYGLVIGLIIFFFVVPCWFRMSKCSLKQAYLSITSKPGILSCQMPLPIIELGMNPLSSVWLESLWFQHWGLTMERKEHMAGSTPSLGAGIPACLWNFWPSCKWGDEVKWPPWGNVV